MATVAEYDKKSKDKHWEHVAVRRRAVCSRDRALKKGVPHTLTTAKCVEIFDNQGGVCALSGLDFRRDPHGPYAISIDRIEAKKGYVEGNVRFILHGLNDLKGVGTDQDMWDIINAMAGYIG